MKNLIKKFSVYLTVCMCLVSMTVMAAPGYAAEYDIVPTPNATFEAMSAPAYMSPGFSYHASGASYDGTLYYLVYEGSLPPGTYMCEGLALSSSSVTGDVPLVVELSFEDRDLTLNYGELFVVSESDVMIGLSAQSLNVVPVIYHVVEDYESGGIYYSAYDILKEAFYGDVELTDAQDITLTMMATLAALVVIALPFVLLFGIISMCGRWR